MAAATKIVSEGGKVRRVIVVGGGLAGLMTVIKLCEAGIPVDLFTPVFAVSRMSGWTAHVLEQYANNRLIRPRAEYTGPQYPQTYVPLDRR